jgi:hypothetical protein
MNKTELDAVFDFDANSCPDFTDGECSFEVTGAKLGNSKSSGQTMMTLHIKLTDINSAFEMTDEHIVPNTLWKLKSLLKGAGRSDMFSQDVKPKLKEYIGLKGKCKTRLEQSAGYPDKHVISSYISTDATKSTVQSESPVVSAEPFIEDEIPF